MLTVFCRFQIPQERSREGVLADIKKTIDVYKDRAGLIRKYICLDFAGGRGVGVYLWNDRDAAERFFASARSIIAQQTGGEPEIEFIDTHVIVDNPAGTVETFD